MVGDVEGLFREIAAGHEGDGWAATEDVEEREEEEQPANAQAGARHAAAISLVVHGSIVVPLVRPPQSRLVLVLPRWRFGLYFPSLALRVSGWGGWRWYSLAGALGWCLPGLKH